MIILSVRPAVATAIAALLTPSHRPVDVRPLDGIALSEIPPQPIIFDAVGTSRAFDRLIAISDSAPHSRIAVLVAHPSDLVARLARRAGARAIFAEVDTSTAWLDLLNRLPTADFITSPSFRTAPSICPQLTGRQLDVYLLAVRGLSDEQIAAHLGTAVATAETHRRDVQIRLGCAGNRELITHALLHGVIDASDVDLKPPLRRATRRHCRAVDLV